MQKGNKFKQISTHIIVYAIYVIFGSTALVFPMDHGILR